MFAFMKSWKIREGWILSIVSHFSSGAGELPSISFLKCLFQQYLLICCFTSYVTLFADDLDNILNKINEKAKKEL